MSRLPRLALSPMTGRHMHEVEHAIMLSLNPWFARRFGEAERYSVTPPQMLQRPRSAVSCNFVFLLLPDVALLIPG